MTSYRHHPERIAALVQDDRVHRDLYLSDEIGAVAVGGHGGGLRLRRDQGTNFHWPLFICTITTPRLSEP